MRRIAWNLGLDGRTWGGLWWVSLGGVECSCILGSLIVRWDVWELVGEKMVVDDLHFWVLCTHFRWGLGW